MKEIIDHSQSTKEQDAFRREQSLRRRLDAISIAARKLIAEARDDGPGIMLVQGHLVRQLLEELDRART